MRSLFCIMTTVSLTFASASFGAIIAGPVVNPANGHSYYVLDETFWQDAENSAVAMGGHLATINDLAEQNWVWSNFSSYGTPFFWIGFNDIANEGEWVWSSGEPVTFTNWRAGEPNNVTTYDPLGEDSGEMYPSLGQWNDRSGRVSTNPAVVEVVPEPSSLGLLSLGGLALLRRRR